MKRKHAMINGYKIIMANKGASFDTVKTSKISGTTTRIACAEPIDDEVELMIDGKPVDNLSEHLQLVCFVEFGFFTNETERDNIMEELVEYTLNMLNISRFEKQLKVFQKTVKGVSRITSWLELDGEELEEIEHKQIK